MAAPIGPGDWVECVDARLGDWFGEDMLRLRAIYCVRDVVAVTVAPNGSFRPGLRLVEVMLDIDESGNERAWDAARFRPIYRPKSEIIEALKAPVTRTPRPAKKSRETA